jgi:hypothetical protein
MLDVGYDEWFDVYAFPYLQSGHTLLHGPTSRLRDCCPVEDDNTDGRESRHHDVDLVDRGGRCGLQIHAKLIRTPRRRTISPFGIMLVLTSVVAVALAATLGYLLGDGSNVVGAVAGAALLVAVIALAIAPLPSGLAGLFMARVGRGQRPSASILPSS